MSRTTIIILVILFVGILYRLALTANGNFLFNMDNGRDMVDVREMVVLQKPRLTGPTSAIEGLFNGPAWYYLLAIPFVLSQGDPYASILMEIALWAVGGFFLLKLISKWSKFLILPIGVLWVASNYIVLTNYYAFNPNPVTLLSPLFIYLLVEYLEKKRTIYIISTWVLAGLFFNFEMNFGVFTPLIIFASLVLTKNAKLLKQKWFWVGFAFFILNLLPQLIFDLKHQFIMSRAIIKHLSENGGGLNILTRFQNIATSFYNSFLPTLMNHKLLAVVVLLFSIPLIYNFLKAAQREKVVYISLIFIFIPFFMFLILPVTVNPWHLGGEMVASLILIGYLLKKMMEGSLLIRLISLFISLSIVLFGVANIYTFFMQDFGKPNLDPSLYKNEISTIDYVYKYANGQNFKAYVFIPSIYDYPYQYLFWWYGKKKYGYIPADYAYAPNKPQYIHYKDQFEGSKRNYKGLVFLIKEPNQGHNWKSGWEAAYKSMKLLSSEKLGSIEIEVRQEFNK